ncbi:uncharacterized protein LOC135151124 [Daucus carota subsp. sativus]|uniref:uncharacterized protein LOC135151124 n=1 Tax=Daucus carota subsp. sativus TaxID=79200 RepID=UPI003082D108
MARFSASQMKFIKVLSRGESVLDSLEIPPMFCKEYGHKLYEGLKLSVGDIFEASVKFNRQSEVLLGMKRVYETFKLKGGESLIFDFSSSKCVRLYIIDTDEMEVFYPKLIFPNGSVLCPLDRACKWGLKFVKFMTCMKEVVDTIEPPETFVDAFGSVLRHDLTYCLINGDEVHGFYDIKKNKLTGFGEICKRYGVVDLSYFDMMVLTYDGRRKIYVSLFDTNHVEVLPPSREGNVHAVHELNYVVSK